MGNGQNNCVNVIIKEMFDINKFAGTIFELYYF